MQQVFRRLPTTFARFKQQTGRRLASTGKPPINEPSRLPLVASLALGFGTAAVGIDYIYKKYFKWYEDDRLGDAKDSIKAGRRLKKLDALTVPQVPQPSVVSQNKEHALYLWIYVKPGADAKKCAKTVANLQKHVDVVCPPDLRDENDEIWAGAAFGPNFYKQAGGTVARQSYTYPHRRGTHGDMPSSGGDIFVHAKSDSVSKLFELTQQLLREFPAGSIDRFEDIYSFTYKGGRDLTGFIDGTENPADDDDRFNVAVDKQTAGSYMITQRWVHRHPTINTTPNKIKEAFLGRSMPDSTELKRKPHSSHVARMTGGNNFEQEKKFQIVRQSMPYGSLSGESGLFFIAYAESPENFEYMLDRMVGAGGDGIHDDVMRLTDCVSGTYWYMPSQQELARLGQ